MKTIRTEELPADLRAADLFASLDVSQEEIVIESRGEPTFVPISAASLRQRREAKERLFTLIEGVRQNHPSLDSDNLLTELEECDLRELHYGSGKQKTHRALFRVFGDRIEVLAIRHHAQRNVSPNDF